MGAREALVEVTGWLERLIRGVDSSLLAEWEELMVGGA
jgi:hypothetical protein